MVRHHQHRNKNQNLPIDFCRYINTLSANPTKWSNTLKQFAVDFNPFMHVEKWSNKL